MPEVTLNNDMIVSEYPLHAVVGLDDIRQEFDDRRALKPEPHLVLVKLHGLAIFDSEAQRFLASNEHVAITKAVAILCDKEKGYYEYGKILVEAFRAGTNLGFPVELFDEESDALDWLKSKG